MSQNVFIVNDYGIEYSNMFKRRGWKVVDTLLDASVVQFTGGSDVTPYFYGHWPHAKTHNDLQRDLQEQRYYLAAAKYGIPMAGICRGGQFLNVMSGGTMWQDVSLHCMSHEAEYTEGDKRRKKMQVTSTHHQMMIPANDTDAYLLLMIAQQQGLRAKRSNLSAKNPINIDVERAKNDIEVLFYHENKALCFQPHPEFKGQDDLSDLYFRYIDIFLLNK